MKLSVLTPSYQCEDYIQRAYDNLCSQTHGDWEWVFVNDGSTDGTEALINKIAENDSRVKVFSYGKNLGRGSARNFGVEHSSTDFIVVWDVDDLYHEERLEKIAKAFTNGFDYFCSYVLISDMSLKLKGARHFKTQKDNLDARFVHATLAFNKALSTSLNYPETMRAGEDLKIMLILQSQFKGFYCKEYLMIYFEDREVNVFKTIDVVKSRLSTLKAINENFKVVELRALRGEIFKVKSKILILYILSLVPSMYLLTVKFRSIQFIDSSIINQGHLNIFNEFIGKR
ncbi:glycosyltransferase family 2 protein [Shewanella glacialipiscicola]|uniref:glycosyltransferase family 2 protein n=1 Tax=Shewanella glacialipiscicola TaxID=614069 RepID=UPI003D7B622D